MSTKNRNVSQSANKAKRSDALVMATAMANAADANTETHRDEPEDSRSTTSSSGNTPTDATSRLPASPLVTPPVHPAGHHYHLGNKHRGVPHIYHDFAQVPEQVGYARKKTGGVTQPFPEKLQEMLDCETSPESQEIVSWLPHGRAFIVRKPKLFTHDIMPK